MSDRKGKKKPKSYYIKSLHTHKKDKFGKNLDVNMKGFLVTCNGNEKQAVREMYNLLNEYADKLYGFEQLPSSQNEDADGSGSEEEDVEAAMKKEVDAMKEVKPTERRFKNVNTKARNTIFIKTTLDDPCALAHIILSDIYDTGVQKSRYAIRMLPITNICKCNIDDIGKLAKTMFKQYFETPFGTGLSYRTNITIRSNTEMPRDSVIRKIGHIIQDLNPLHRVNHDTPDFVVLVEIIANLCCLSVIKDFAKLKKYNLIEVSKVKNAAKAEQNKTEENEQEEQIGGVNVQDDGGETEEKDNDYDKKDNDDEEKDNDDEEKESVKTKVSRKRRREDSELDLKENPVETKLNDDVGNSGSSDIVLVSRKRKHEDSLDNCELDLNEGCKTNSLSREGTVIMESVGQFRNIFDRNETVVMESLAKTETVVMQTLDRDVSVMDALSKGESVMDMGPLQKDESTMDVLCAGDSVMDAF